MATLALSKEFLPDYAGLPKPVQKKVDEVFTKFSEHTHAGLHLEKLSTARDPRVRTIRIDQGWRGIIMAPQEGDTFLLVRVLTHDKADQWVERNIFGVNAITGALEIRDIVGLEAIAPTVEPVEAIAPRLFADRSPKDFVRLGIPEALIPIVQRIGTEAELEALTMYLPQGQGDALQMLVAGYSVEDAWAELVAGEDPGPVDTADVEAALDRPASKSMFYVLHGSDELLDMLSRPFDLWRTFLHPTQRRLAYRDAFAGPARVTGGAGTGKTVVAMHRAKALADRLELSGLRPILFTTFTRNLATAIEANLRLLGGPELLERVDVVHVDTLASRFVRDNEGPGVRLLTGREEDDLWSDVVDELGTGFSSTFVRQEWRHVVLAQDVSSRDAYFAAPRPGRGVRLTRRQRAEVWKAIEEFTNRVVERGARTFLQLADAAAGYLASRSVKPYAHVIVDEAQDLHPAQWRMLRAAVAQGPNDLFIVGDTHQRIYDNRVALSRVGINVRGRSTRLRINYRTTHEILRWSMGLLTGESFDDMDEGEDTLAGYRSQLHGPAPTLVGYPSRSQEFDGLIGAVRAWIDGGVRPDEIGVAARTVEVIPAVDRALQGAKVRARVLGPDDNRRTVPEVEVATMHRMKGLEYRCVAVVDVCRERVPLPAAVTPEADDAVEHRNDLQRERSLVYVACTRARDDLRVSWVGPPSEFIEPLLPHPDPTD
jgi:superfamily I DNA/RNA helicase